MRTFNYQETPYFLDGHHIADQEYVEAWNHYVPHSYAVRWLHEDPKPQSFHLSTSVSHRLGDKVYRYQWLNPYGKQELLSSLYATAKKYPTLHIEAVNTGEDHIHLQIEIAPSIAWQGKKEKPQTARLFFLSPTKKKGSS